MDYLLSLKLCARKQAGVVCVGGWGGGRGIGEDGEKKKKKKTCVE